MGTVDKSELTRDAILGMLRELKPTVLEKFGIELIGLFGSRARGDNRPDSDVDIAYRIVDLDKLLSIPWNLGAVHSELAPYFGDDFSFSDWDQADEFFRSRAERDLLKVKT